jgi:hypothetical protein
MANGFGRPTDFDTLLVFDLGGGTLDISVLESFEGILEVGPRTGGWEGEGGGGAEGRALNSTQDEEKRHPYDG